MKTIKSTIHKLEKVADCGCRATGEYTDAELKVQQGDVTFTACDTHKDVPGLELLAGILKEAVGQEALETKLPPPPAAIPTVHPRTIALARRTGTVPQEGTASEEISEEEAASREAIASQEAPAPPIRTLRTGGTPVHRPSGAHRPTAPGKPSGGGGGLFHRSTNAGGGATPLASAAGLLRTAAISPGVLMDLDNAVDEDSRVTDLLESTIFADDPIEENE
jgi:hypothetical protein